MITVILNWRSEEVMKREIKQQVLHVAQSRQVSQALQYAQVEVLREYFASRDIRLHERQDGEHRFDQHKLRKESDLSCQNER